MTLSYKMEAVIICSFGAHQVHPTPTPFKRCSADFPLSASPSSFFLLSLVFLFTSLLKLSPFSLFVGMIGLSLFSTHIAATVSIVLPKRTNWRLKVPSCTSKEKEPKRVRHESVLALQRLWLMVMLMLSKEAFSSSLLKCQTLVDPNEKTQLAAIRQLSAEFHLCKKKKKNPAVGL